MVIAWVINVFNHYGLKDFTNRPTNLPTHTPTLQLLEWIGLEVVWGKNLALCFLQTRQKSPIITDPPCFKSKHFQTSENAYLDIVYRFLPSPPGVSRGGGLLASRRRRRCPSSTGSSVRMGRSRCTSVELQSPQWIVNAVQDMMGESRCMSRAQSRDALNDVMSESEEEEMRARMAKMRGSRLVGWLGGGDV